MKITERRTKEILNLLGEFADHAPMFEEISKRMFRDTAALIRQLQDAEQAAWHAGLDAGREQGRGKDHAQQPPAEAQPVAWQFQDREGKWRGFMDERHRQNTIADGSWPIRALYAAPPSTPVGDSLLQTALRNLPQYISKSGLVGPDKHSAMQCFEVLRDALAQQPASSAPDPTAGDAVAMQPVAEVAMSDDGYKIGLLGPLRAHRLPLGTKLYASPRAAISGANAPVGVEAALSLLRAGHWREVHAGRRYMRLEVTYDYAAWERLMEQVEAALAHQPAAEHQRQQPCGCVLCVCEDEKQCHGCGAKHCGNRTDHPAYVEQQPAAVDEAMVFRLAVWMAKKDGHDDPHHLIWEGSPPEPWGEVWNRYEDDARSALTAALAAQQRVRSDD